MILKTPVSMKKLNEEAATKYPINTFLQPSIYKKINGLTDLLSASPMEYKRMGRHLNKFIKERAILRVNKSLLNKISLEIPKMLDKEIEENLELCYAASPVSEDRKFILNLSK